MSDHPYRNLPDHAFWHQAISSRNPLDIAGLYRPKFKIRRHQKIATAGSCFAQHFSRALIRRNCVFVDEEPAPDMLPVDLHKDFNYGIFSARYANIYTPRQMLQTLQRAMGLFDPVDDAWVKNGKLLDPLRPMIEPAGYDDKQQLDDARNAHLAAVRRVFTKTKIFVFTLGLTEAWINKKDGMVYPMCPGTTGGEFDSDTHGFHNFTFKETYDDLAYFIKLARETRPDMKFLLTVSPVPLTATASGQHVLAASVRSKSVLRAVCAEICDAFDFVDYFPSYEAISSHPFKGQFFEPDMRAVSQSGVDFAMDMFFDAQGIAAPSKDIKNPGNDDKAKAAADLQCEEEILKSFARDP